MFGPSACLFCRLLRSNKPRIFLKYYGRQLSETSTGRGDPEEKKRRIENAAKSKVDAKCEPELLPKPKQRLKENIFTIPNALCLSRILLSPLLGYFVVDGEYGVGLAIFAYAAGTDLIDGWIARTFPSQQSVLGSALDPVADKVLVSVLVLSLTYVALIPLPLTALIVGRDIVLIVSGCVLRYVSLDPPRTLARYFDITAPTVRVKPTGISKFNTGVQLCMVGSSLAAPVFGFADHAVMYILWYGAAGTTIASGLSYLFAKDTYEILRRRTKT